MQVAGRGTHLWPIRGRMLDNKMQVKNKLFTGRKSASETRLVQVKTGSEDKTS